MPLAESPSAGPSAPDAARSVLPGATLTRRAITAITATIALLGFAVSLGDCDRLCRYVGITPWIAWLIGPTVDLSVVGLLIGLRALALARWPDAETRKPRALLAFCGLVSLALNTAQAWTGGQVGTALIQAIAPCLLIGWSQVGPWLLRALHDATAATGEDPGTPADTRPGDRPGPVEGDLAAINGGEGDLAAINGGEGDRESAAPVGELERARVLDAEHRATTGRPISRDVLRERLHIGRDRAAVLVRTLRAEAASTAASGDRPPSAA